MPKGKNQTAEATAPQSVGDVLSRPNKPVPAKEKQKAIAFFNWEITNEDGTQTLMRSSKGFSIFDNEFKTREEDALVKLAEQNDGSVLIANCRIRIVLNQEKGEIDTSALSIIPKAQ